jgi:hypothetical protein
MIASMSTALSIDDSKRARLQRLRRLTKLLDSAFLIPGTNWRIGLDPIIGLIPGAGDLVTAALSVYIVVEAHQLGARRGTMARMVLNVAIDFLGGAIPLVGDIFDAAWKCNLRNLSLLEKEIARG